MPPSDPGPQWSPPSPLFAPSEWLFDDRPPGGSGIWAHRVAVQRAKWGG